MKTEAGIDIKQHIIEELIWEPGVDATNINVSVDDGVVTLRGIVPSYYDKISSEDAALRVLGVRTVINEIDVKLNTAFKRSDEEIKDAVSNAFTWDTTVPQEKITISVANGFVTLGGKVNWNYQKLKATEDVNYLAGVKGITNNITVEPAVTFDKPAERIERALERSALVDKDKIEVTIENNKVILNGKVPTWSERREAERLVWATPGILKVKNNLAVNYKLHV